MILDKLLQFDPAATAITVTADSTNTLDLSQARDLAVRTNIRPVIVVTIGQTFLAAGAATLQIALKGSADNATFNVLVQTDVIAKANLTVQSATLPGVIHIPLASYLANPAALLPRYLKLTYTVATGPFTAGQVEADLVMDPQASNPPTYAAGITVAN